jgi:hypothetical protein
MSRLAKLALTEARLFWRDPTGWFFALAFPPLLLVILGSIPAFREPDAELGGLRVIDLYVPILVGFVLAMLAISVLPSYLATYREKGILRRLSVTPCSRPGRARPATCSTPAAASCSSGWGCPSRGQGPPPPRWPSSTKYLRWTLIEAAVHAPRHLVYHDHDQATKRRLGRQRGPPRRLCVSRSPAGSLRPSGTCSPPRHRSLRQGPRCALWPHEGPQLRWASRESPTRPDPPTEEATER